MGVSFDRCEIGDLTPDLLDVRFYFLHLSLTSYLVYDTIFVHLRQTNRSPTIVAIILLSYHQHTDTQADRQAGNTSYHKDESFGRA